MEPGWKPGAGDTVAGSSPALSAASRPVPRSWKRGRVAYGTRLLPAWAMSPGGSTPPASAVRLVGMKTYRDLLHFVCETPRSTTEVAEFVGTSATVARRLLHKLEPVVRTAGLVRGGGGMSWHQTRGGKAVGAVIWEAGLPGETPAWISSGEGCPDVLSYAERRMGVRLDATVGRR